MPKRTNRPPKRSQASRSPTEAILIPMASIWIDGPPDSPNWASKRRTFRLFHRHVPRLLRPHLQPPSPALPLGVALPHIPLPATPSANANPANATLLTTTLLAAALLNSALHRAPLISVTPATGSQARHRDIRRPTLVLLALFPLAPAMSSLRHSRTWRCSTARSTTSTTSTSGKTTT